MTLTLDELKSLVVESFGEEVIQGVEDATLQRALYIRAASLVDICTFLRDSPKTYFDFLSCISAVDDGVDAGTFTIVYHLASFPFKNQLVLKVVVHHGRSLAHLPSVPSVAAVWRTADWHEREAFDLVGIYFENHPDLRRILLPDDWEGYPLRKDYEEAELYHGISIK